MISVVIPTLGEAETLPFLLEKLRQCPQIGEILVSDGGSSDTTATVAREGGAMVIQSARGRGPQLNAGARAASGEVLWFLHADCWPEKSCAGHIERAVENGALGGNFRLKFRGHGFYPRLFERIARVQRRFGIFYGDSGIWATRATFFALGEFPDWPLFEDLAFARRLEKTGRARVLPARVWASARRFETQPARVLKLWLELQIRFELGQSPHELARIYREKAA